MISGLIAIGIITGLALVAKNRYQERKQEEIIKQIRQTLATLGEVQVLYVDAKASNHKKVCGGAVLKDGKSYGYCYEKGTVKVEEDLT